MLSSCAGSVTAACPTHPLSALGCRPLRCAQGSLAARITDSCLGRIRTVELSALPAGFLPTGDPIVVRNGKGDAKGVDDTKHRYIKASVTFKDEYGTVSPGLACSERPDLCRGHSSLFQSSGRRASSGPRPGRLPSSVHRPARTRRMGLTTLPAAATPHVTPQTTTWTKVEVSDDPKGPENLAAAHRFVLSKTAEHFRREFNFPLPQDDGRVCHGEVYRYQRVGAAVVLPPRLIQELITRMYQGSPNGQG